MGPGSTGSLAGSPALNPEPGLSPGPTCPHPDLGHLIALLSSPVMGIMVASPLEVCFED